MKDFRYLGATAHQNWIHASWRCESERQIRMIKKAYPNCLVKATEQHDWNRGIPVKKWWMVSIDQHVGEVFRPKVK